MNVKYFSKNVEFLCRFLYFFSLFPNYFPVKRFFSPIFSVNPAISAMLGSCAR